MKKEKVAKSIAPDFPQPISICDTEDLQPHIADYELPVRPLTVIELMKLLDKRPPYAHLFVADSDGVLKPISAVSYRGKLKVGKFETEMGCIVS